MSPEARLPVPHSLESVWTASAHPLQNSRSTNDLPTHTDVLIIGAGFAGTSTAYHLLNPQNTQDSSLSVTILEARGACCGATGRNGGHLKPDTYFNVPLYAKLYGPEEAARIAKFESSQVLAVKTLVEEENIDCDFHLTRAVDVYLNEDHALATELAYKELRASGIVDLSDVAFTRKKDAERISGVKGAQCCFSFTAAHIWPYKLILHLLGKLVSQGVNLQTHTPVTSISETQDASGAWAVQTPRGVIIAKQIVYATNGYTSSLLPSYKNRIIPVKGICSHITTPPSPSSTISSPHLTSTISIRHSSSAYDYLIPRSDGSIVVGGARSAFWSDKKDQYFDTVDDSTLIQGAETYFDGYMQRHFTGWEDSGAVVSKLWTGIMGYSSDYMSHIGEVPDKPNQFIIAGFSGHGMPQILLASKGLAAMVRHGVPYEETGLPAVFKTSKNRLTKEGNELIEGMEKIWEKPAVARL